MERVGVGCATCVQKCCSTLSVDFMRLLSTVGTYSRSVRRTISMSGSHMAVSRLDSFARYGAMIGCRPISHDSSCDDVPTTFSGSMKMVPTRETVAGDATARSSTSKT
eukprot:1273170-Prymnesium_polylepis.1